VVLVGIIALIAGGLNLGLDFKSGRTMTLVFSNAVGQEELRAAFSDLGYQDASIQHSPKNAFIISDIEVDMDQLVVDLEGSFDTTVRTAELGPQGAGNDTVAIIVGAEVAEEEFGAELEARGYGNVTFENETLDGYLVRVGEPEDQDPTAAAAGVTEQERIKRSLTDEFGPVDDLDDYARISPEIAAERVAATGEAVAVAAVAILLYIAWSFRKIPNSFRFGVCAILVLVHDAFVVLTVFSLFRLEVNSFFIIALLTVMGYGVNNIIVVFDRVRENRGRYLNLPFATVVNMSIMESLTRSLNTSLTTLLVLLSLLLLGGPTIYSFVLALAIGVVAATYSSLFVAGQLLVAWEHGELARLFRWIPRPRRQV
jgi:preprotein translocase subunit SecF